MLGKSYMSLNNYPRAVAAFERVVELEDGRSAQGLVELGEALLAAEGGQTMPQRAMSLFENALAIEPNNQAALFWGGLGAVNRGDTSLAADRWERLLGTNPPEDIRDVIEQRVAEWRGEPAPPTAAAAQQPAESETAPEPAPLEAGAIVSASIALSEAAQSALPRRRAAWRPGIDGARQGAVRVRGVRARRPRVVVRPARQQARRLVRQRACEAGRERFDSAFDRYARRVAHR
jgi:tetratricopeptide (TPR) repeat protein